MKRIFGIMSCFLLFISCTSIFSKELKFETGSWDSIKVLAQKSNKIIFLDAYTDWCMWCNVLDKKTFSDEKVIDFINANFIPAKYNMEEGFGKILAMKYRVRGFPAQLFFTPEGKLIFFISGYSPPVEFIDKIKIVLDKNKHIKGNGITDVMEPDFPNFYKTAFEKYGSKERRTPDADEITAFLNSRIDDLTDEISWSVMSVFQTNEEINNYFLAHIGRYEELYDFYTVNKKLYSIIYENFENVVKDTNAEGLKNVLAMIDKYDNLKADENKMFYEILFYQKIGNWNKFIDLINENVQAGKLPDYEIYRYSRIIDKNINNVLILQKAIDWVKPIIEKSTEYKELDIYASFLFKTKNFSDAKIYAEKAIEMGNQSKEDVKSTEILLEKIKLEIK